MNCSPDQWQCVINNENQKKAVEFFGVNQTESKAEFLKKLGITMVNPATGLERTPANIKIQLQLAKNDGRYSAVFDPISPENHCINVMNLLPSILKIGHKLIQILDIDETQMSVLLQQGDKTLIWGKVFRRIDDDSNYLSMEEEMEFTNFMASNGLSIGIDEQHQKFTKKDELFYAIRSRPFINNLYNFVSCANAMNTTNVSVPKIAIALVHLIKGLQRFGVTVGNIQATNICITGSESHPKCTVIDLRQSTCSKQTSISKLDIFVMLRGIERFELAYKIISNKFKAEMGIDIDNINENDYLELNKRFSDLDNCNVSSFITEEENYKKEEQENGHYQVDEEKEGEYYQKEMHNIVPSEKVVSINLLMENSNDLNRNENIIVDAKKRTLKRRSLLGDRRRKTKPSRTRSRLKEKKQQKPFIVVHRRLNRGRRSQRSRRSRY